MVYRANLDLTSPRHLHSAERARLLPRANRYALTFAELVERAGVRARVTGGPQCRVVLWRGPGHAVTLDERRRLLYAVDSTGLPQRDPERAARILEVLAYGCSDYAARETVCGRGLFIFALTPEHGRAWLAEIGRRGGGVRTRAKAAASRANGRRRRRT